MTDIKEMLIKCGAIKYGKFTLASGKESSYYINIKQASTNPAILRELGKELSKHVSGKKLAGMELGAVPLVVAVALELNLPFVIIRKTPKEHGTKHPIEGIIESNDEITIIEDVSTTGSTSMKVVDTLKSYNALIKEVVTVVNRDEGATQLMIENNIKFKWLIHAKELVNAELASGQ